MRVCLSAFNASQRWLTPILVQVETIDEPSIAGGLQAFTEMVKRQTEIRVMRETLELRVRDAEEKARVAEEKARVAEEKARVAEEKAEWCDQRANQFIKELEKVNNELEEVKASSGLGSWTINPVIL
jgi:hypothetical protein